MSDVTTEQPRRKKQIEHVRCAILVIKPTGLKVKPDDGEAQWVSFSKFAHRLTGDLIGSLFVGADVELALSKTAKNGETRYWIEDVQIISPTVADEAEGFVDHVAPLESQGGFYLPGASAEEDSATDGGSQPVEERVYPGRFAPRPEVPSPDGGEVAQLLGAVMGEVNALRRELESMRLAIREAGRVSDITDRELAEAAFRQATAIVNTCIPEVIEHGEIKDIRGAINEIKREAQGSIPLIAEMLFNSMVNLPLKISQWAEEREQDTGKKGR